VPTASARSFLFVPADQPRRLEKAWESPADVVIADLEDAVAEEAKGAAREVLRERLARPRTAGAVCVRINALESAHAAADLELLASAAAAVDAVMVPKAAAATLAAAELGVPVIALVETAAGVLDAAAIASAPGVERLMLGTVDLTAELGVDITVDSPLLAAARATLALASAAAGLAGPIDGVWIDIADEDGLRAEARVARAAGFAAKACVHPRQLGPVEEELAPSAEEVERARRIVEAGERALAAGEGAVALDGRMVDLPVIERARRTLAAAGGEEGAA